LAVHIMLSSYNLLDFAAIVILKLLFVDLFRR